MNCLKCGRETPAEQVFCEECRLDMEKHPVRPGTVVQLPKHVESHALKKSPKRRAPSPEEQVKSLRRWVRTLAVLLVICMAVIAAMAYPSVQYYMNKQFKIGQNYSTVTTTTAPSEAADTIS